MALTQLQQVECKKYRKRVVKIEKKLKNGYSLVEVLVAMTILVIGILPIVSMFPQVFTVIQKSTENEERARIGLQIIEFIKLGGYDKLYAIAGSSNSEGFVDLTLDSNKTYKAPNFESIFITPNVRPVPAGTTDYFRLNAKKGMNLGGTKIYWAIKRVNVALINSAGAVASNPHYSDFIVGAVVVGTGKDVNNTITQKEKETRMQFIVTPLE